MSELQSNQPGPQILPTREGYNLWAKIYDAEDNALIALEEPQIAAALGDVSGLRIADVGCGTGRHAVRLAAAGATVTAVDFSEAMLARARCKPGAQRVNFIVHDLSKPLPLPSAAFDRVICCLVLDHISALKALFTEMGRICRPEGRIVISVMHPAMMLRGLQARFVDPESGREVRPQSAPNQICDYVMAAIGAGLRIEHMAEYAVDEELAARSPRAVKYLGWPMLLTIRLCPA